MDKISLFTLISCASRKIYYNDNISKPIMLAFTDTNYENKRNQVIQVGHLSLTTHYWFTEGS